MERYFENAAFVPYVERAPVGMEQKIKESSRLLQENFAQGNFLLADELENINSFHRGYIPRLSPYDVPHLEGTKLVEFPQDLKEKLAQQRSYDLIRWNQPSRFLYHLKIGQRPFAPPVLGDSLVMNRLKASKDVVAFENLKIESPSPQNGRRSRSKIEEKTLELSIMGQARIPFALGSVPDVGSHLAYVTMAQAGGMVFISRDKILSDVEQQATLAQEVITTLKKTKLPQELRPTNEQLLEFAEVMGTKAQNPEYLRKKYFSALRESWIANVGAAIETDSEKGMERVKALYDAGVRLFRIYSPEGGTEIIDTAKKLRDMYGQDIKIVGGQIMDYKTAIKAEKAGCDAIFIGVAGGSQCTTSVKANIPVNAPNLLYELRGTIGIPIGIEGGGVGTDMIVAFALGASFLSKPGEIGVSWEGAGGRYIFQEGPDKNPFYWMPYGGEASVSAKWWKDSIDGMGRPKFVEGETGVRRVFHNENDPSKRNVSLTGNLVTLRHDLSTGLVFQRADSIAELHQRSCENIVQVTPEAASKSQPYAK